MYDSGSAIDVVKSESLLIGKVKESKGILVRNSSGLYRINKAAEMTSFGKRYLDKS